MHSNRKNYDPDGNKRRWRRWRSTTTGKELEGMSDNLTHESSLANSGD